MIRKKLRLGDDPDETEGRKLYRAHANALAQAQMSMSKRRVKLKDSFTTKDHTICELAELVRDIHNTEIQMLGHRVRVLREGSDVTEGILQSLKPEGIIITPEGYGLHGSHDNIFIPMHKVIEIIDKGPVYR